MGELLPDTWFSRDRRVLVEILREIESVGPADVNVVCVRLGLTRDQIYPASQALIAAGYVDGYGPMGPFMNVSAEARRELGAWPTPENVAIEMATVFEEAAQGEQDSWPEEGAADGG